MIERHRTQRPRDMAVYLYAIITSVLAVAALILAIMAICQIKGLKTPPPILVLRDVPAATPAHLSSPRPRDSVNAAATSSHVWTQDSTRPTPRDDILTTTQAHVHSSLLPRALFVQSAHSPSTTATILIPITTSTKTTMMTRIITPTTTIATTQTTTPPSSTSPNPLIPYLPSANMAARRYVAPLSWQNLKRWVAPVNEEDACTYFSTKVASMFAGTATAVPFAEQVVQTAFENGAVPNGGMWGWGR
ncbi:hypothetical protein DE146DRAFT_240101 [Phaeosphaeria sp. MPI-PUGE-AT-0046c]|nr:hypothetical protein DE146DRAFT_240101 [Phaeosphaeria sp. MPI-PUGE-AT-0046c]